MLNKTNVFFMKMKRLKNFNKGVYFIIFSIVVLYQN